MTEHQDLQDYYAGEGVPDVGKRLVNDIMTTVEEVNWGHISFVIM